MTGSTTTEMGGQDVRPTHDRVTIGTGLCICLAKISYRVELDTMVNGATGATMVMAGKIGCMASDTLAAASDCWRKECAVVGGVVTGAAAFGGMDLAAADKRRAACCVATDTISRRWGHCGVDLNLVCMTVVVAIEVSRVTVGAGAAVAKVNRGITVAIRTDDTSAIGIRVTGETVVVVDGSDRIAGMTVDAQSG